MRSISQISLDSVGQEVFRGVYGDWQVEESDVREVLGYRAGISVAAAGDHVWASTLKASWLCSHKP